MKLSQITPLPQKIELLDPLTNKSFETPCFLTLVSMNSKIGKKVSIEIQRERIKQYENKENVDDKGNLINVDTDSFAILISRLVVGWDGIEDMEYTPENAEKLLLENELMLDFVYSKVSNLGNFLTRG
jgi:hypothetical protein